MEIVHTHTYEIDACLHTQLGGGVPSVCVSMSLVAVCLLKIGYQSFCNLERNLKFMNMLLMTKTVLHTRYCKGVFLFRVCPHVSLWNCPFGNGMHILHTGNYCDLHNLNAELKVASGPNKIRKKYCNFVVESFVLIHVFFFLFCLNGVIFYHLFTFKYSFKLKSIISQLE